MSATPRRHGVRVNLAKPRRCFVSGPAHHTWMRGPAMVIAEIRDGDAVVELVVQAEGTGLQDVIPPACAHPWQQATVIAFCGRGARQ